MLALVGLFAAALPFVTPDDFAWNGWLVAGTAAAALAVVAGALLATGRDRLEPLAAAAVAVLAVLLVVWDTGSDTSALTAADWLHAVVSVGVYVVVAVGVAVLGTLRDRWQLTATATAALVVFTTFQSFAVFAQIIEGAWLFVVLGLVFLGTGVLFDRTRRGSPRPSSPGRSRHEPRGHPRPGRRRPAGLRRRRRRAAALQPAHRRGLPDGGPAARPDRPVPRGVRHPRLPGPAARCATPPGDARRRVPAARRGGRALGRRVGRPATGPTPAPTSPARTAAGRPTAASGRGSPTSSGRPSWSGRSPTRAGSRRSGSTTGGTRRSSTSGDRMPDTGRA